MKSEITFHLENDLPKESFVDKLQKKISLIGMKEDAINATELKTDHNKDKIIHWQLDNRYVFLVSRDNNKFYRVHVENTYGKDDISTLKRHTKEVMDLFKGNLHETKFSLIKASSTTEDVKWKLKEIKVVIWQESEIFLGSEQSWTSRLIKCVRENALAELYVPVATLLVNIWMMIGISDAIRNVVIASIAMGFFVLFKVTFMMDKFVYEDA